MGRSQIPEATHDGSLRNWMLSVVKRKSLICVDAQPELLQ
jgi:hypothetical protein